jgi:hypothetical protein
MKNTIKYNPADIERNGNFLHDKLEYLIEKEQMAIKSYQSQNLNNPLRDSGKVPSVSNEIRAFIKAEFSKISNIHSE